MVRIAVSFRGILAGVAVSCLLLPACFGEDVCAERSSGPRAGRYCLFPFRCDTDDEECDCDRACCAECGRKKPKQKKTLLSCFACKEPPRGDVAVSIPGRIQRLSDRESAAFTPPAEKEAAANKANGDKEAGGLSQSQVEGPEDRLTRLENDLTDLTLLVERLAMSQAQIEQDVTNTTRIVEEIAKKVSKP
jgi:hypothetical protein